MATLLRTIAPVPTILQHRPFMTKRKANVSPSTRSTKRIKMASQDPVGRHIERDRSPVQPARVKRFHSKSRKGCLTCRTRRVKCDERRKPMCLRCERGGYTCEWQDHSFPMLHRSASNSEDTLPIRSRSGSIRHSPPFPGDERGIPSSSLHPDSTAMRILILFIEMVHAFAPVATAMDAKMPVESDIYYNIMTQASSESIVVQKLLAALDTLQDRIEIGNSAPSQNTNFMRYYSESVTDLRQSSHSLSPEIIMITCVLLAICEYLMGSIMAGAQTLRSGASILAEQRRSPSSRVSPDVIHVLEPVLQAFSHPSMLSLPGLAQATHDLGFFTPSDTYELVSLTSANNALRQLCFDLCLLMDAGRSQPSQSIPAATELRRWTSLWLDRCNTLEGTILSSDRPWLQLLKAHHQMLDTLLQMKQSTDAYENVEPYQYDSILLRITAFQEDVPDFADSPFIATQSLSSHLGVIAPLLFVTMHCTDLSICRAALSKLKRIKVAEGYWNSCIAFSIALFILDSRRKCQEPSRSSPNGSKLPPVEVRGIVPRENGKKLQVQIKVSSDQLSEQGSKIFSDTLEHMCPCQPDDRWSIERIVQLRGYQGFITSKRLEDCSCHEE